MLYFLYAVVRILSFLLDVFLKVTPFKEDLHNAPHMMKNGGCWCTCTKCVKTVEDFNRCICLRCNEECTSFGRLGSVDRVLEEQAEGHPVGGKPARWIHL